MAKEREQTVSHFIDRIKRHPVALIVTFVAALIVSLASLTDSIGQLSQLAHLAGGMSREEAREELSKLGLPYTAENFTESARNGDLRVVRLFLTAGMEADASGNAITALMHAAANNDGPMIDLLLDAGASVDLADTLGIAAGSADPETLRRLLARANVESIDRAFVYAAAAAQPENVAMLWEKVTDRKKAASLGLLNVAESMEDNCPDGGLERLRYQLGLGADPNIADAEGYFPLLYVSHGKCLNAVQLLLDARAEVNARCECSGWLSGGWTALLVASDHEESRAVVELLLDRGADMQARTNDGSNALMLAVEKNNGDVVNLLVGKHIDPNAGDAGGVTPLMNASGRGLQDMARRLIDSGADINARSQRGYTALMRAAREGNVETIRYLIERGAAVDVQNESGQTALMLAAQRGNAALVELLLAGGAQSSAKDLAGRTAADLVAASLAGEDQRNDREKILFLLKQKTPKTKRSL
jgi:ankyrin repeat protein